MMGTSPLLRFVLAILVSHVMGGSYLITSPEKIIRGTPYVVTVNILNTTEEVSVEVQLINKYHNYTTRRYEADVLKTVSGTYTDRAQGLLSIPIENTFTCGNCFFHVRGRGGLQFEREDNIGIFHNLVSILIQTDKAIYKPGQIVRYRVLAIYPNLQLYTEAFNIVIKDPNNNKIKLEQKARNESAVFEGSLQLGDQPPYGDWKIEVALADTADSSSQYFTVKDYELPRFEVKVELAPYLLLSDTAITGTVDAKYTFGQPVKGRVELRVGPNTGLDLCGKRQPSVETTFEIDGRAEFTVPVSDVQRIRRIRANSKIYVTAIVKEAATGVRLNGTSAITFYSDAYKVKFLDNTPNVFKPGLPYTAFVQVSMQDDMPPPVEEEAPVSVYAYATYRVVHPEIKLYGRRDFTGMYPLPGYNVSLPANGVLPVELDIPDNATSITMLVHYKGRSASKTVSKPYSKSNNFIQLNLENNNLKPRDTARLRLRATEPLDGVITYVILSRGSILSTDTVRGNDQMTLNFEVPVTAEMAPTAHLLAYYNRRADEIVADSIAFNIDGIFSNEVSVAFSANKSKPGESIDITVTADPDSQVNLLAVDQSVLLLKSGNDITAKKVESAISAYDPSEKPSDSEFALSYSSSNIGNVFRETGLNVITDVSMREDSPRYSGSMGQSGQSGQSGYGGPGMHFSRTGASFDSYDSDLQSTPESDPLKEVENVRKIFPEAWLWQNSVVGANGQAVISTTVPDTITSWIASAFATNLKSGLGVAPVTSKLTVFRPFFVSLTYSSAIKRDEIAIIQATVFNYLSRDTQVTVTLKASPLFTNALSSDEPNGDAVRIVTVPADEQRTVYFPIAASEVGVADIHVMAQGRYAADAVLRKIAIEPEGAPVQFNYPMFASVKSNSPFAKNLTFQLPTSTVKGSEKARVKVSGDLIGPSLDNIESLLSLPTGCGEQSMVKFAPNLYIAKYLRATGQMTEFWNKKIMSLLATGYQRQLTYQRYDGSFSAFGNLDESGSTWLTAFVSKTFNEARELTYVDPSMLVKAVDWILDRQNLDGSFNEFGRLLDPNTLGTRTGPTLTAYVLLSLLKNRNLAPFAVRVNSSNADSRRAWKLGNATEKATAYLEGKLDSVTSPFTMSLISYALGEAQSRSADAAFNKLLDMSKNDGPLTYWHSEASKMDNKPMQDDTPAGRSMFKRWSPPRVQSRPIDILITSYALLSFTSRNRLHEGIEALKWLTSQRNSNGGFASTQDTTVALQALATVATKTFKPSNRVRVMVTGDRKRLRFRVNERNALRLQVQEFNRVPKKLDVKMKGTGVVVAEIDFHFNVNKELSTPSFDVSTVLLDDDIDSFNLMICTKWLWDRKTGMVVQEIGIPSGFKPDLTTLGNVVGMKRSERRGNVVAIYFDEIGKTSTCYSLLMTRVGKVAKNQPSFIRTYDYYEPGDQSTVFFHPRKLQESTVADVCPRC